MLRAIINTGSLPVFSFTGCLRTLLIERDSAGLGSSWNDEAYFSKNDSLTLEGQRTDAQVCRGQTNYVFLFLVFVSAYIHTYGIV